jgi:ribulose-phosphate 3-epimerase
MIRIAPSLLAADFANLGAAVATIQAAGGDYIHYDVMDGDFVPNLTVGAPVLAALRSLTPLPFDVHLMVSHPERLLEAFVKAGADIISVHAEACPHLHRVLQEIRSLGAKPAVAINPGTPLESVFEVLPYVDQVLLMTVNPGFGGQRFIPSMPDKVSRLRKMIDRANLPVDIEVDGGIDRRTAPLVLAAGATVLVAGTAVFGDPDGPAAAISALRSAGNSQ